MKRVALFSVRAFVASAIVSMLLLCCSSDSSGDAETCAKTIETNARDNDKDIDTSFESPDVEWCRSRPTWRPGKDEKAGEGIESVREKCQRVLGYEPDLQVLTFENYPQLSSTYNVSKGIEKYNNGERENYEEEEDEETYYQHPVLERPLLKELQTCVDEILPQRLMDRVKKPSLTEMHRRGDGLVVMAIVENALNEHEADAVQALAECNRRYAPMTFETRDFSNSGGGNDVTYLAGFLQMVVPGVAYSVLKTAKTVWEAAGWSKDERTFPPVDAEHNPDGTWTSKYSSKWCPDPIQECGIRTTEHLSYDRWKGLGFHDDTGSDYTVLVALSDPSDYEGGNFSICMQGDEDCTEKVSVRPKKLSAVVFLSEFSHGVEEIKSEGRRTFASELWRYGDVSAFEMRPTPEDYVLGYDDYEGEEAYG